MSDTDVIFQPSGLSRDEQPPCTARHSLKLSLWHRSVTGYTPLHTSLFFVFVFLGDEESPSHLHHHQSLNREGRWGTQMILKPVFSIFPVLLCPLGLAKLQACPFPDVVFPPLPLSALSSSPFRCALQDGSGQT